MVKADYIRYSPAIDVEKVKNIKNPVIVKITIGDVETTLEERDAKELLDGLEETLIPWEETRSGLESKIEDMTEELENLRARVEEYEKECGR